MARASGKESQPATAARPLSQRGGTTPPTMRDIALATGVSQSTVSRVLSGTPTAVPIAEATRQRVTETAERLGYRPNPLARGLRGAPTMLLGVIVRDVTDPFFAGAIEAASLEANRRGYNVVLGHAHQSADEAVALWGILEARHCDALLFLGDLRDRPELVEDLKDTSIPVVALWHGSRESGIPTVSVDNRAGMAAVVDHLARMGHQRIAFAGPKRLGDITEREDAYLQSLVRHRLARRPEYLVDASNDYGGGAEALDVLMDLAHPPHGHRGAHGRAGHRHAPRRPTAWASRARGRLHLRLRRHPRGRRERASPDHRAHAHRGHGRGGPGPGHRPRRRRRRQPSRPATGTHRPRLYRPRARPIIERSLSMPSYVVGVDFGTESGRAVVIDAADGREVGSSVYRYANGVIDAQLPAPDDDVRLGPDWALQDPEDYLRTFQQAVPAALATAGVDPAQVVGVGIDFTACTMLPTKADGTPLCVLPELRREPHAWVKLWKHHAAQPEADRINAGRARSRRGLATPLRRQDLVGVVLLEGTPDPRRGAGRLRRGRPAHRGRRLGHLAPHRGRDPQ